MKRLDYGFDAPGLMRNFLGFGGTFLLAGLALGASASGLWRGAGLAVAGIALVPFALGLCMYFYATSGKFRMRDAMIGRIDWRGDESVLDIGTGRGLLLVAAAKRLGAAGRAVGVDIWRAEDLTGNSLEAVTDIVAAEGVADRVSIRTEDARSLSFAEGSFDVVLSLYCLHNIDDEPGRRQACFDIARVLKRGGRVLVADLVPTGFYAAAFREAGLVVHASQPYIGVALAPMWMVDASKP